MRSWLLAARESFWFLPAVFGVAAILLAQGLVVVDRTFTSAIAGLPVFNELSASGGRSILTTVGTSMLTVAGTSFSITISVLATTSSTYGPRLVRNFMADRSNQFVLAMFTSTFLYCLIVLRSVRTTIEDRVSFVPTLGIHFGVLLAVVDVGVLVYFIHHIATSVQITTLQKRVQTDLVQAVDHSHPAELEAGWSRTPAPDPLVSVPVRSRKDGYVQQIDLDDLLEAAEHDGVLVEVDAMPGEYLIEGDPLVHVSGPGIARDDDVRDGLASAVRGAIVIGVARTPAQDLRFALQQLIEVAVRGLASGTNDPYTTVSALDLSRTALVPLVRREEAPRTRTDEQGAPRVAFEWPSAADLVGDVVDSLRQYGMEHPSVVRAGLEFADRIGSAARSDQVRDVLAGKVHDLLRAYKAVGPDSPDLAAIAATGKGVLRRLEISGGVAADTR